MFISLFPTPFDHFHFHPTLGLDPALILTLRPKAIFCQKAVKIAHRYTHTCIKPFLSRCEKNPCLTGVLPLIVALQKSLMQFFALLFDSLLGVCVASQSEIVSAWCL